MTVDATVTLSPIEAEILRRLHRRPATGSELLREIGANADAYATASARLWNSVYLRGLLSDGCCNAPCGPDCVSAFNQERVWRLTVYGEAVLQEL